MVLPILIATASVAVIGLIIGILLVNVGKKFKVEVDPKEAAVRDALPGNNCGGCGYAGCDSMAAAIVAGDAPVNGCPVGGDPCAARIGNIMGVETDASRKMVAYVKCAGNCDNTTSIANYIGIEDCISASAAGLGNKSCQYGCLGYGSCVKACKFDAIHVFNGIARVDRDKCKACGMCIEACPKNLIEMVPYDAQYTVRCDNRDKGPSVKKGCTVGCIACGICTRQCENDAVHVEGNISRIDYDKCVQCGKCAEKCPVKIIEKRFA